MREFESDKYFDIDPFRGLVCLSLVALHFYASALHGPLLALGGSGFDYFMWNIRPGVESFFVLAGFMVAHNLRDISGRDLSPVLYFVRRCVRLLIPYVAAVLLAAANLWAARLVMGFGQRAPGWADLLSQLFLVQEFFGVEEAAVGFWSLVSLEQFYILWLAAVWLAGTLRSEAGDREPALVWFAACGCVASLAAIAVGGMHSPLLSVWAAYLFLGILLYRASGHGTGRVAFAIALAAAIAAGIYARDARIGKGIIATGALWTLARGARFPDVWTVRALAFFGRRSYSIYLVHGIVGYRVFSFYPKVARFGDAAVGGLLLVAALLGIAASLAFYRTVELPCHRLARRIHYRLPASGTNATERRPRVGFAATASSAPEGVQL